MGSITVAVATPSGEMWHKGYGQSLVMLAIACLQKPVPGYDKTYLKIIEQGGSILAKSRQELVQRAIEAKCTHILFIDSDQGFPAWTLHKMASAGKLIIAANVAIKRMPSGPTARNKDPEWPGGTPVYTRPNSSGLEQVWRIGTGIMLINLDVFKDLPLPWFETTWWPPINDFKGEDWHFCELMEKRGVPIFIDHDLSKVVEHIGTYRYTMNDVEEIKVVEARDDRRQAGLKPVCMVNT